MKFNLDIKDTNLISLPHHPSCGAVTSLTWLPTFTVQGGNMTGLHCINKADVTQVELFFNNFQAHNPNYKESCILLQVAKSKWKAVCLRWKDK